ncbi:hypothetical protein Dsin_021418 [Dipteronia sinensis]|uniref:HAT C-terminal dimerisation domain-containing protein n=1 Tax=Dipteronia sinensis TaxID=43782 RepID=A0AAD9ZZR2_9ROSI|nr:hypothetical protein Dsin_021418 [Dipteronia sinensis]
MVVHSDDESKPPRHCSQETTRIRKRTGDGLESVPKRVVIPKDKSKDSNKSCLIRCQSRRSDGDGVDDLTTPAVTKKEPLNVQNLSCCDVIRLMLKRGITSLNPMKAGILHVYNEEKDRLRRYFSKLSCRFTLSIDRLKSTASGEHSYYCLTVHFLTNSCFPKLNKKILGLIKCDRDPLESFKSFLLDWNIDMNILCLVTVDIGVEDELRSWLISRGSLPFGGNLLDVGHLVDFLEYAACAREELAADVFQKVKQSLDYVHKTSANDHKFQVAVLVDKVKSLGYKVTSQGTSDLKLLDSAVGLKEEFCKLERLNPCFKSINLTAKEWDEATAICRWFELLDDADNNFGGSRNHTTNVYFPKVCDIFMQLLQWKKSDYRNGRDIASDLTKEFFEEYWRHYSLGLAIPVILDPRCNIAVVKCWYQKIYGDNAEVHLTKLINDINDIYEKYATDPKYTKSSSDKMPEPSRRSWRMYTHRPAEVKCELSLYLKQSKFPSVEYFDLLRWWGDRNQKFPTLARMAKDFLAIPYSTALTNPTLRSDIMDVVYSKEIDPDIREAYLCTKHWLEIPER